MAVLAITYQKWLRSNRGAFWIMQTSLLVSVLSINYIQGLTGYGGSPAPVIQGSLYTSYYWHACKAILLLSVHWLPGGLPCAWVALIWKPLVGMRHDSIVFHGSNPAAHLAAPSPPVQWRYRRQTFPTPSCSCPATAKSISHCPTAFSTL